MRDFWKDLSERERLLIMIGGGLAVVFVVLQLVIAPAFNWRSDARQRMNSAESLYELVAEAAPRGGASTTVEDGEPVRNVVSQSAAGAGVTIVYINARTDSAADANIASTSPSALYDWLAGLQNQHNIVVDNADIARDSGNPEVVRAQLSLSRRGS